MQLLKFETLTSKLLNFYFIKGFCHIYSDLKFEAMDFAYTTS